MNVELALESHDVLVLRLREAGVETRVEVRPARAGADSLLSAVDGAMRDGYGECFWPGLAGGQYWWMFKRTAETLEVVGLWTRGGASLWEHVFRATDEAAFVREQLAAEVERLAR
jgi:hypothetical protein